MRSEIEGSKFVLIEHGDSGQAHAIRCFTTEEALESATMHAIFGEEIDAEDSHWDEWKGYLSTLREEGLLTFEGDPPLEWMRAWIHI